MEGIAKNQHYVPQFILKNFKGGKKKQVYVFNKKTQKQFRTHVRNVAAENGFYNFKFEGVSLTIEHTLSKLETLAAPVIEKIVELRSLNFMTIDEREILSLFFAVQFTRTKLTRDNHQVIHDAISKKVTAMGYSMHDLEGYTPLDENKLKEVSVTTVIKDSPDFAVHFMKKDWILHETDKGNPFYIGDHPVSLFNQNDFGPYGNLGLGVRGIQINCPLTPTLNIAFYCQSVMDEIMNEYAKVQPYLNSVSGKEKAAVLKIENMINGFKNGTPHKLTPDNVIHLNALQVSYSDTFIFSHLENFELANDMVAKGQATSGRLRTD